MAWSAGLSAASAPSVTSGITATPALLNFRLSKDAPEQSTVVSLTNNYDAAVELTAEFKGIDESGGRLIPTNQIDQAFNRALHVSATDIILAPHQTFPLTVQLQNDPTLLPGGHYATLVLTQQTTSGKSVPLRAQMSLGIFGVKIAGGTQSLIVTQSHTNHWLLRLPSSARITYRNTGNEYVVPRASIQINRINSAEPVVSGISNDQSRPLFPGKALTDTAPLTHQQHIWLPTRLQQTIAYRYDGAPTPTILTTYIWYVPPLYPLLLLALAAYGAWRWRQKQPKPAPAAPLLLPAETLTRPRQYVRISDGPVEPAVLIEASADAEKPVEKKAKKPAKKSVRKSTKKPANSKPK